MILFIFSRMFMRPIDSVYNQPEKMPLFQNGLKSSQRLDKNNCEMDLDFTDLSPSELYPEGT